MDVALPNEPPQIVQGLHVNIVTQVVSLSSLKKFLGSDQQSSWRDVKAAENAGDSGNPSNNNNTNSTSSNELFKVAFKEYKVNPFVSHPTFPYPDSNCSLIMPSVSRLNSSDSNNNNSSNKFSLTSPIIHKFKMSEPTALSIRRRTAAASGVNS